MTGPALGKLKINAKVTIVSGWKEEEISSEVYIHLKGYAFAKVTHLDIEHKALESFIKPKTGMFLPVKGINKGIEIKLHNKGETLNAIRVYSEILTYVLQPNEKTGAWVGGKLNGIYVGFKKNEMKKLEEIAKIKFGVAPK